MKKGKIIENIEVIDYVSEGKGLARVEGKVIFIEKAFPGDKVDVKIVKKKKDFLEGRAVNFHTFSSDRTEAFCEHYGVCGGCKMQDIKYESQLAYKQKMVLDAFRRIGKVEIEPNSPIMGSDDIKFFRNKLEYTFSNKGWLTQEEINSSDFVEKGNVVGFHVPGRFDRVLDVNECSLQKDISNQIRNGIRTFAKANDITFFDLRQQHGFLRNLTIRTTTTGEVMVILSVNGKDSIQLDKVMNYLKDDFSEITSLNYVINEKRNDSIFDLEVVCFDGKDHIIENLGGLNYKIQPKSFFQTNTNGAKKLYDTVVDFAQLKGVEVVFDLYTGTGTIANYVAKTAKKVIGIELIPEAIEDAKINSILNNIDNTVFFAGDVKDAFVQDLFEKEGRPEVLIINPARAGMHHKVVETIIEIAPEKIIYVSCNASTQARDVHMLSEHYTLKKLQTVDMFPHTAHVENVVLLEKKK